MTPRGADAARVLQQLQQADLQIDGRFSDASNLTLLATAGDGLRCVYKPRRGERPLWDFPQGTLAHREVAMYQVSAQLGWDVVPETALRTDGPLGAGVCQRYIEPVGAPPVVVVPPELTPDGWRVAAYGQSPGSAPAVLAHRDSPQLRRIALLDVIANNADRKGGHILADAGGRLWGIDHGLTFHSEDKLRTVLWGFAGEEVGPDDRAALRRLGAAWDAMACDLADHLTAAEIAAARARLAALTEHGAYPQPEAGWPRLPMPAL